MVMAQNKMNMTKSRNDFIDIFVRMQDIIWTKIREINDCSYKLRGINKSYA